MKDFYNNYEGVSYANMAKEVEEACNCIAANPCSSLASEIDSISSSMQSVSAECQSLWEDVVETNFSEYVTSIVNVLKEITSSINSSFSKAESLYKTLKELLEQLKSKNDSYQSEYKSKPSETIASNENNLDGTVRYVPNPAYTTWQNKVKNLEVECKGIISQIKKTSNELMAINGETVAASVVAGGAGGISVPTFEMPQLSTVEAGASSTSTNTASNTSNSSLEQYLSSVSSDPNKCAKIIDLRTVLPQLGTTSVHTVMGWQLVTDKTSKQYSLRSTEYPEYSKHYSGCYDSEGFAKIDDRYVVATTRTFGNVGDYIDIEQKDGTVIKAIIGDIKNQNDKGCNEWGHQNGKCVVEFVVDCDKWYKSNWETAPVGKRELNGKYSVTSLHPEWNQDVVEIRNLGSYFDLASQY